MGLLSDSAGLLFRIQADGSQASSEIKKIEAEIVGSTSNIGKSATAELDKLTSSAGGAGSSLAGLAGPAGIGVAAVAAIGTAAVGAGAELFNLAEKAGDITSKIKDFQDKTGLGAEAIQTLQINAEKSGISLTQLQTPVAKFSKLLEDAKNHSDKAIETLKKLYVTNLNDLDGSLSQALETIHNTGNEIDKTGLSMSAFGTKSGEVMKAVANNVNGNLSSAIESAKKLGLVLSQEDVDAGDKFHDTLKRLNAVVDTTITKFAVQFAPELTKDMEIISKAFVDNQNTAEEWGKRIEQIMRGVRLAAESDSAGTAASWIDAIGKMADKASLVFFIEKRILEGLRDAGAQDIEREKHQYDNVPASMDKDSMVLLKNKPKSTINPDDLEGNKAAKKRKEERKKAEKDELSARIELLKKHLSEVEKLYDETNKRLREKFKDSKDAEGFAAGANQARDNFIKEFNTISPQLKELERQQATAEKKTPAQFQLIDEETVSRATAAFNKYRDAQAENQRLVNESVKKGSEERVKILEEGVRQQVEIDKATAEKRIAVAEASGVIFGRKESEVQAEIGKAREEAIQNEIGDYKKLLENDEVIGEKRVEIKTKIAVLEQNLETEKQKTAKAVSEATHKETAKYAEDWRKAGEALAKFKDEIDKTQNDIDAFQKEQDRKVLVNTVDSSYGKDKLDALVKLRDFDIQEDNRQRKAEKQIAEDERDRAEAGIKNKDKEAAQVKAINDLYTKRIELIDAEHDANQQNITNQSNPAITQQTEKASGKAGVFANILGGLAGGGVKETNSTGKIKSQAQYLKDVYNDIAQTSQKAVGSMIGGLANLAEQWIVTGKFSVRAAAQMVAGILAELAIEDAINALHEYASGLAAAANPLTAPFAPMHFAAATAYAQQPKPEQPE